MELYNRVSLECSKLITQRYSTSFTLGIQTLDQSLHLPIYGIYGYVRCADEIVDTFHGYDKEKLLKDFRQQTYEALQMKISTNPVLQAFQLVVNEYKIDLELIDAFLDSMEMDLHKQNYKTESYETYIYGSAEVVGLMCLKVFCKGNDAEYQRLKEPARKLGAAFQKVNFLRDMGSDFEERGRVYFPDVYYENFDSQAKVLIEKDIEKDFRDAYKGIVELPREARLGVYLAYKYYIKLFEKIRRTPSNQLLGSRVRVPNTRKMILLVSSYFKHRMHFI
ncbi:MAG: phytoene/squalene synthase family protein [Cytophagales bacterium]|nr:MAG: phytoene/squalene synthase family protein [Cytophagales bacterium]TAF61907.1 MAG: phytoene/squalene synthase family protein [Cytophagales bacterium]